jgi:NADH-quinone oxidoreductase subunit C
MISTELLQTLQAAVPGAQLEGAPSIDLHPTIYVSRDELHAVAQALRERPELDFALLAELTAADFWPREPRFEIIYLMVSIERRARLRLKVRIDGRDAHLPTVSDIWPAANWLEREVWDLFGVVFDGHPELRRLLMPDDWQGHPLRKDYPVQIQKTPQVAEPLQVSEEEFRANLQRDWQARRD